MSNQIESSEKYRGYTIQRVNLGTSFTYQILKPDGTPLRPNKFGDANSSDAAKKEIDQLIDSGRTTA